MTITTISIVLAALTIAHFIYGYYGKNIVADKVNTILELKSYQHPDFTLGLHYTSGHAACGPWTVHKFIIGMFALNLAFEFFRRESAEAAETETEEYNNVHSIDSRKAA